MKSKPFDNVRNPLGISDHGMSTETALVSGKAET